MPRRPAPLAARLLMAAALLVVVSLAVTAVPAGGQGPDPEARLPPDGTDALVERLGNAWFARDLEGYVALWAFDSPGQREAESVTARTAFAADETQLRVLGPPRRIAGTSRMGIEVQVFTATEPQAQVEYWRLLMERRRGRWAFVGREGGTEVEGLVHLPLDAEGWRAQGVSLRLEDFELQMEDGTLFRSTETVGPTALVFVGRGHVRFSPRPLAEREQLRQYGGSPRLERAVDWAFVRLHPADFDRLVEKSLLSPDPTAARRRSEAVKRWTENAGRSFIVDADLPLSPWWLYPSPGDALVEFPWKGSRVLTFSVAGGKSEDLNLFERDRGLKVCSYPSAGRPTRPRGGREGPVDVLQHSLNVRFDPSRFTLNAVDTLRLRLRTPASTIRFKLHDDFQVSSVSLERGDKLLFLRVREQGTLVVSLGPHARLLDEFSLTVRYSGRHDPAPVDHELLQLFPEPGPSQVDQALLSPPPIVYSSRTAWYPRPDDEDYATLLAQFDTPEDRLAVTGGELLSTRSAGGRTRATYRLGEPGKYFSVVVGRLRDVGMRRRGDQRVRGFGAPRTAGHARRNMETAEELLLFFAEHFGPCPYPVINHVLVEAATPGGHSPPGMVYLQKRPVLLIGQPLADDPANFRDLPDFFLAHELAHQWWGQGVAPTSYRDEWLSEAWAQYAAALWIRHRKGEAAFRDMLGRMARWARRYDEHGPIHLGPRLGHLKGDARVRRALVYDKGALVLHMLRRLMGDEAFFGGARSFIERHRYGKATTEDLRAALEEVGGLDLEPYFERWIYGTGLVSLRWSARTVRTTDGHRTTVKVQPRGLPGPLPLDVEIRTGEGWKATRVTLDPSGGSWTVPSPGPVRDVRINENRGIFAESKKVRSLPPLPQR